MSMEVVGVITHIDQGAIDIGELGEEPGTHVIAGPKNVSITVTWPAYLEDPEIGTAVMVVIDDD